VSAVILAASTIIIARVIGSIQYGEYSKVFVPIGIALLFQDPGITVALTRYISLYLEPKEADKQGSFIITGLALNLATSIILSLILYLFAAPIAEGFLQQKELEGMLKIASFAVIGHALINTTNSIFIGYMRVQLQNLSTLLYAILKGSASTILVLIGFGLPGAIVSQVAAILITGSVALVITLLIVRRRSRAPPSFEALREMLRFGAPIYLSNLIGGALSQLTSSLMVLYVASSEIGNYGVALNFTVLVTFLITPIQTTIYPLFTKLGRGTSNLKHAYANSVKYSALIAIPASIALIGLSEPMISLIYGDSYPTAPLYFSIYLLTSISIGLGGSCQGSILNSQGETRVNMWRNFIVLATGAVLAILLVPRWGILGLIISLIASAYPALVYGHVFIKNKLGLTIDLKSSVKIYVNSLVSLIMILILNSFISSPLVELTIGALAYLTTYLIMLKITKTLNEDDYQMFRSILGTTGALSKTLLKLLAIYKGL
jgi:O-antigen/teichoic acid export membrane protein